MAVFNFVRFFDLVFNFFPGLTNGLHCTENEVFHLGFVHIHIQFPAELVTFTEEILNGKLPSFFCCVKVVNRSRKEFCKEYTLLTMC